MIYEVKGWYWGKNQLSLSSSTLAHSTEKSHLHTSTVQGRSLGPQLPASPPPPTVCSHHEKKSCITFIFTLTRTPATVEQSGKVQGILARIQHNQTWTKAVVFNLWVATPFGDWIIFSQESHNNS